MKFLIVGDLHGQKPKIYFKDFDAIIAPGDFCSDAPRKYMFQALRYNLENPGSDIDWYDLVGKKRARKMIRKSLDDGRKILEYLNSFEVPVYLVPGNWEWTGHKDDNWMFRRQNHYRSLIKDLENLVDVQHKSKDIKGYSIIGYGVSSGPEYPQYKSR